MGDKQNRSIWSIIIFAILFLSILFAFLGGTSQNDVEVYDESDRVETQTGSEKVDTELDVDMVIETDDENHYSIQIPADWQKVTKSGFPTYVHSATGSSLQIQVLDYDPSINNMSADVASADLADEGYTFLSYTRLDHASYELLYQDFKNATYDYVEDVLWSRDKIVKLVCTFDDAYYSDIWPYFEKSLSTFSIEFESPIPDGYVLYYNESADFEVGIPETWTLAVSETSAAATDPDTGSTLTASVSASTMTLENMSATEMMGLLNSGQDGFMMKNFVTSENEASTLCSYVIDSVQYLSDVHLYANGIYLYFVSVDYEDGMLDSTIPDTCFELFREFASTREEDETGQDADAQEENPEGTEDTADSASEAPEEGNASAMQDGSAPAEDGQASGAGQQ